MTKQMMTTQSGGYGLGVWLSGKEKSATFSHPGKNEGFMCILFAYLETGQGAVVMTNGDGGNGLFNEIVRAIAGEYDWPDYRPRVKTVARATPALHESYVGEYEVSGIRVAITAAGDQLFVQAPPVWPRRVRLYPSAADTFFFLDEDVDLTFVKNAQGSVSELRAVTPGQSVTARKVK
jgi:hypothetical protein